MCAKEKKQNRRITAYAVLIVILLLALMTGGVYGYLQWSSDGLKNQFIYDASISPQIIEDFNGTVKKDVRFDVGDTGYSVYIRADLVATWKNADGEVLGKVPQEGTDYSLTLMEDSGWFKGNDGYFYYETPVASGAETNVLFDICQPLQDAPEDGYTLSIEILAQTLQSAGTTDEGDVPLVTEAWGIAVDENGNLYQ